MGWVIFLCALIAAGSISGVCLLILLIRNMIRESVGKGLNL